MKTTIKELTNQELKQYYANAKATRQGCGGHTKASLNRDVMIMYATELLERGILLDDWDIDMPEGIFNGKGSH
jgi:hypothetical protein